MKLGEQVKRSNELLGSLGLDIDASVRVSSLTVAKQQMVEIAKAIFTILKY